MLAKLTGKNQITLPKALVAPLGAVEYFDVQAEKNRLVLTPVRINAADRVRDRLAGLALSGKDIADAVAWARRPKK